MQMTCGMILMRRAKMPKYKPQPTAKFKKDVRKLRKRGYNFLEKCCNSM